MFTNTATSPGNEDGLPVEIGHCVALNSAELRGSIAGSFKLTNIKLDESKRETDLRLLALGALIGLVIAGFGILRQAPEGSALPDDALARVNDTLISGTCTSEPSRGCRAWLTPVVTADILQMLIDDELLVQRGIELGMMSSDLAVRQAVIDSLVASITAEADTARSNGGGTTGVSTQ